MDLHVGVENVARRKTRSTDLALIRTIAGVGILMGFEKGPRIALLLAQFTHPGTVLRGSWLLVHRPIVDG